jgi:TRAP-type C4-dicarboxylate transport system substrate-binding protein
VRDAAARLTHVAGKIGNRGADGERRRWMRYVRAMSSARTSIAILLTSLALITTRLGERPARADAEVLTIGTSVPANSTWGAAFRAWAKSVKAESQGRLELRFYYASQQGEEATLVTKMRTGQLDGAALTAVGLGNIDRTIEAFELPGLFADWTKLDQARDGLAADVAARLRDRGFTLIGLYDMGVTRLFTTGAEVASPADLRTVQPAVLPNDLVVASLLTAIGDIDPVHLGLREVLPNLSSGRVDAVFAAPLFAEQLQWTSSLDVMMSPPIAYSIGGVVFADRRLQQLPNDLRLLLVRSGENVTQTLRKTIRNADALALVRVRAHVKVIEPTAAQLSEWAKVYAKQRAAVRGDVFDAAFLDRLIELAR